MSKLFDRLRSGRSRQDNRSADQPSARAEEMPPTQRAPSPGYAQPGQFAMPQNQPGIDPIDRGAVSQRPPHPAAEAQRSDTTLANRQAEHATKPTKKLRRRKTSPKDLRAPARLKKISKAHGNTPIVEAGSVTGNSLTVVITIMCFLASLTAGAVYLINQSAAAWMKNIASEVTIQIQPVERESSVDMDKRITKIAFFLAKQRGISDVRPLSKRESAELLEPWLGSSRAVDELPVPRLIALELDRRAPPNLPRLKTALERAHPGATLDDHRHWQRQIRTVTRSMALGGLLILALVGAATTAIIVSATRSAMASNREIVEVLHFVGATDRFIAREFEKHFLTLGVKAGLVGALSAMSVFFIMPYVVNLLGGGTVTASELRRLVGSGSLDLPGYFLLGIVVVVIAALCMLTSRYGVFRILNDKA